MTRVYLHTFGCKANQYDTEVVRQALEDAGARIVDDARRAEVAVVNSCTVTHVGEAKLRGVVRRMARGRPELRTVIMGCAAAVDDGRLAGLPGVVSVQGGADPARVLAALGIAADRPLAPLRRFAAGTRAWLKIQDGCDEHCTFCATVVARGPSRSRPAADLVAEARGLAAGVDEIVLTGVHIGAWGADLGGRDGLGGLTERLVRDVPGVRFRLSSVEATEIDDQLVELMASCPERLAPHVHAPLQSGSDRVLKRMGRHWYTATGYRRRIERIAHRLPVLGLGADVIVGFPGETDTDHAETVSVVRDLPFTYVHAFPYSERPGTAAGRIGPPVEPAAARARSAEIRDLVADKAAAHARARAGGTADVVVLDRAGGRADGLTEDYLTVGTPADVLPATRFRARLETDGTTLAAVPVAA